MKFTRFIITASVLALIIAIAPLSPAQAQTADSTPKAASHKLGGTAPRNTSTPTATPAAQPMLWSKVDVDNMCAARWSGKPKRIDGCIQRNSKRIGSTKTDSDAAQIKTGQRTPKTGAKVAK